MPFDIVAMRCISSESQLGDLKPCRAAYWSRVDAYLVSRPSTSSLWTGWILGLRIGVTFSVCDSFISSNGNLADSRDTRFFVQFPESFEFLAQVFKMRGLRSYACMGVGVYLNPRNFNLRDFEFLAGFSFKTIFVSIALQDDIGIRKFSVHLLIYLKGLTVDAHLLKRPNKNSKLDFWGSIQKKSV